jgi:cyclic pyranopterin phosphate synthase
LADEVKTLSHVGENTRPKMVDVTGKAPTLRVATASARVKFPPDAWRMLSQADFHTAKGPVANTAIVAGTMAAKRTHELIPFCHVLALERCDITVAPVGDDTLLVQCTAAAHDRTGVEMEALTGAMMAALAIYDMCKSLSHGIVVEEVRLESKHGGTSDFARSAPS